MVGERFGVYLGGPGMHGGHAAQQDNHQDDELQATRALHLMLGALLVLVVLLKRQTRTLTEFRPTASPTIS